MNSPFSDPPLRPDARIADTLAGLIGPTPLVRLGRFSSAHTLPFELLAKLEFLSPLGSVKDRTALGMVTAAERSGHLKPGGTVVEATGGNLALSLASLCAARGYRLVLVLPESVSLDRRRFLSHFGAEIVLTPASRGADGARERAVELQASVPGMVMLSWSHAEAGAEMHRRTTGLEIWEDTAGAVDGVIGALGTGATLSGVSRALKERKPGVQIVGTGPLEDAPSGGSAARPGPGAGPAGRGGVGSRPGTPRADGVDEVVHVPLETALAMAQSVARLEGLPAGISSGAVLAAAVALARRPGWDGRTVVAILASGAERYLSTPLFDEIPPGAHPSPSGSGGVAAPFSAGFPSG
ncbi:cysteine synthase family protein [Phaeovibrio sulfidiphilus]|uniref:Cysteine synthase B n=1 Tax=Phaeovibrio sulfidiphilus TaxID=1220600 RepID=A0A8J6YKN7_9PROT|nr:cysteine synthase family protein [Phaeovibrio sulfidiphilus]MBE1236178.1 cysteine synthase family protein [Phaeovibrio sulfidiphilus]